MDLGPYMTRYATELNHGFQESGPVSADEVQTCFGLIVHSTVVDHETEFERQAEKRRIYRVISIKKESGGESGCANFAGVLLVCWWKSFWSMSHRYAKSHLQWQRCLAIGPQVEVPCL